MPMLPVSGALAPLFQAAASQLMMLRNFHLLSSLATQRKKMFQLQDKDITE